MSVRLVGNYGNDCRLLNVYVWRGVGEVKHSMHSNTLYFPFTPTYYLPFPPSPSPLRHGIHTGTTGGQRSSHKVSLGPSTSSAHRMFY